jgi:hypothetical protein
LLTLTILSVTAEYSIATPAPLVALQGTISDFSPLGGTLRDQTALNGALSDFSAIVGSI